MTEQLQRLYRAVHEVSALHTGEGHGGRDGKTASTRPLQRDATGAGKSRIALNDTKTAKLLRKGRLKVAQKVGEEAVEVVIAAIGEDREAVVCESADLLYHLVVLWNETGVTPDDVWNEMRRREKARGLAEKL
ncbi:phosphoribosyl-ATP diphosphatase [Dongia soli]|uniref:Phosphoribosyl-ATP pyrophosphatase n=1 Tax=Dongia soli TaxID=600628 RepID=A0ABU5EHH6_9PROT|nr:phosphoribosyl-ATP diphosphatase [Dongia soli]MDY0884841.1 phosphoribosyl-ATP diphosphatase [Dongia soli]